MGIGPDSAVTLLITIGDNPERLGSEASFAALCGVSPIERSSGRHHHRRLNRGATGRPSQTRAIFLGSSLRARRAGSGAALFGCLRCAGLSRRCSWVCMLMGLGFLIAAAGVICSATAQRRQVAVSPPSAPSAT
ncbi:transposase [Streptomyces lydicus]|uniref:transposase n=1 Tax=Streptomyces decoyicus TaxID=249567 RepID=UPI003F53D9D8